MAVWKLLAVVFVVFAGVVGVSADQWKLVWQDNFDRSELGTDWYLVTGEVLLQSGRLLLKGAGATVVTERTFAADVRIEFDAEADPKTQPCDLSATIAASKEFGYGYLFAFGGANNQVNQILGFGVTVVDSKPKLLIKLGRVYHIAAIKEGKRLVYTVDGEKILEASADDPVSGPGFDRVGLVTWAGMLVDNFRVYERTVPHPDTPACISHLPSVSLYRDGHFLRCSLENPGDELVKALAAFNMRNYQEALTRFRSVCDPVTSLVGQAWVLGDLGYCEKLQYRVGCANEEFAELYRRFDAASKAFPDSEVLRAYAIATKWFSQLVMNRSGMLAARRLVALGEENNPFYHKAKLYLARYHYWNGAEAGNETMKQQARSWMAKLLELWPENVVLRQYIGEKVPWAEDLIADTSCHPAWAAYLREAYARQLRIMERFIKERQAPDGQLGGGYGDDVELMRTWMQIACISSSSQIVRAGIAKLAEGVWTNVLRNGFAELGDVEHSAEPSADVIPTMLLLDYGNPLWVERNLTSCKTIHDVCMGLDEKGYPRFKSAEIGWNGANTNPRAGGDTGYHARAMKHFIWQAWWGDEDSKDWFARWCDGWLAAAMSRRQGKLRGLIPFTIWYPSGDITPPGGASWYDSSWHYYGNMGGMIYDSFLCAYYLTQNRKFLEPFCIAMDVVTKGPLLDGSYQPGSIEWQRQQMMSADSPQRTALYKWLTGENVYDEYTLRFGDPVQKYLASSDLESFLSTFKAVAESNRYNLELQTTEVLSTDRAALRGALTVFGAYTGAVTDLRDASTPTFSVTYDSPDENFAAVVTESKPTRLRILLYSFHDRPIRLGLRTWRLLPGTYVLNQGELLRGEYKFQNRYGWIEPRVVQILRRADTVWITLPPRKVWVVDLRLQTEINVPLKMPDLAISPRDVAFSQNTLTVLVHNIGSAESAQSWLSVQVKDKSKWRRVGRIPVPEIAPPKNFVPSFVRVSLTAAELIQGKTCRIILDPENEQSEVCEMNNSATVEL
jgi:hypothetical protein